MQSDAKVPEPAPRGITVPAVAVVVLVVTGAIWGVGLFLLGRQTAPPVEVLDRAGSSHLASLNRIDQALVRGDQQEIVTQMANAVLPDDLIGHTALELRRARLTELAVQQKAREAEEAARREAASPAAVLKRLHGNLWHFDVDKTRMGETSHEPIRTSDIPIDEKTAVGNDTDPVPAQVPVSKPPASPDAPASSKPLAELTLGGAPFIPDARINHPTIAKRTYALHPQQGLLRSDDGGVSWRVGLAPLQEMRGWMLSFTSGEKPLLHIRARVKGTHSWLFNDAEDAFFP
jgi:hypothetical protein